MTMIVTKDMIISEVLEMDRGTIPIFFKNGLHCLGCAMASGETIEEACMVHSLDCDMLMSELNSFLASKDSPASDA
jgi:hybrid cluster-associated redox disulfide protein